MTDDPLDDESRDDRTDSAGPVDAESTGWDGEHAMDVTEGGWAENAGADVWTEDSTDDGSVEDSTAPDTDEYGPEPSSTPIERGTPTLEGAVFVLLGALSMIVVIGRMIAAV